MVRPYFATPDRLETAITAANMNGVDYSGPNISGLLVDAGPRDAWVLTNETVDSTGRAVKTLPDWVAECATPDQPSGEVAQSQCLQRLNAAGYRQAVTYHAADRFWAFQAYETAIFAVLSAMLLAFCFLRIRPS